MLPPEVWKIISHHVDVDVAAAGQTSTPALVALSRTSHAQHQAFAALRKHGDMEDFTIKLTAKEKYFQRWNDVQRQRLHRNQQFEGLEAMQTNFMALAGEELRDALVANQSKFILARKPVVDVLKQFSDRSALTVDLSLIARSEWQNVAKTIAQFPGPMKLQLTAPGIDSAHFRKYLMPALSILGEATSIRRPQGEDGIISLTLQCRGSTLQSRDYKTLGDFIIQHKFIRGLDLAKSSVPYERDSGLTHLLESVLRSRLESLSFADCSIGCTAMSVPIFTPLRSYYLRNYDLSNNDLRDTILSKLCIDMVGMNTIPNIGFDYEFNAMSYCRLNLDGNNFTGDYLPRLVDRLASEPQKLDHISLKSN
ncbi:MAG: hypothetical protein ACRYF5_01425, partial [Janthinobacterium lividum]